MSLWHVRKTNSAHVYKFSWKDSEQWVFGDLKNIKDVDENGFFVGNSHKDLEPQISRLFEILDQLNKTIN